MYQIWLSLLGLVTLAITQTSAISMREAGQANLDQDSGAKIVRAEGFLKDINFRSFFEEVGLIGAESKSGTGHHRSRREPSSPGAPSPMIPNAIEGSESQHHFTVVDADDDFFVAESNPYERFQDPTDPYAASEHHREYSSPFASSSRSDRHKVAFDDYGPPKDFFDTDFIDFDRQTEQGNKKSGSSRAEKESPSESKVEEGIDHDPKTKKCREEEKDGMVCEICKDDFGGFSEHCAHRVHSGKDQKYANSRRTGKGEAFDPPSHGKSSDPKGSESLNSRPHKYSRDDRDEFDYKKSPFSDKKKDHSFSSASIPSHTSSKQRKTDYKDDDYAPPSSVRKDYKPSSKTADHSYKQAPKHASKRKQFDHFDHEKAAFNDRGSRFKVPEEPYDAQKESQRLEEAAFQKVLKNLKENRAPAEDPGKKYHRDHRPSETRKNFDDDSESVKEYSNPSSAYTGPTHKSYGAPSSKTSSPESGNTVDNSKPEGKNVAVFAKKSVPRRKPSSYAETESKKAYKPKEAQYTKPVDIRNSKSGQDHKYGELPEHVVRQATQRQSYPNINSHHLHHHDDEYRPMDPAENFKVIGQMVKQFSRKDRTHCKKRINKDGMTCYICPNKHGQVDEDCVYENNNPKDGVHLMYREESSY